LLASVVIPLVILNLSLEKSGLIADVLAIPLICAVTLAFSEFARVGGMAAGTHDAAEVAARRQPTLLAASVLLFVALAGFAAGAAFQRSGRDLQSRAAINRLHDAIIQHEAGLGNLSPSFSVDRVADYIGGGTVQVRAYEKFDLHFRPRGLLGHSIFAKTRDEALAELAESDVIVLTEPHGGRQLAYPMNTAIESYWQDLWDWTVANRVPLATEQIGGLRHVAFVRSFAAPASR
jgi:hypothetical protein